MGVPFEGEKVMCKEQVIQLVDSIINEMEEGEPNDLKNEPSQNPEEELDRVEDDLGGAEGEELVDYEEGDEREGEEEPEDIEELANVMVDSTLLDQDNAYQTYFRTVMKKHDIKGIRGLSSEKRSAFFKDVSAGWRKHKKKKVGESVDEKKFLKNWGRHELPERWTEPKYGSAPTSRAQARKADAIRKGIKYKDTYKSESEEYAKYFNYLAELCGIDDMSILEEEDLAEFYVLVHEAYEVGTGLQNIIES